MCNSGHHVCYRIWFCSYMWPRIGNTAVFCFPNQSGKVSWARRSKIMLRKCDLEGSMMIECSVHSHFDHFDKTQSPIFQYIVSDLEFWLVRIRKRQHVKKWMEGSHCLIYWPARLRTSQRYQSIPQAAYLPRVNPPSLGVCSGCPRPTSLWALVGIIHI